VIAFKWEVAFEFDGRGDVGEAKWDDGGFERWCCVGFWFRTGLYERAGSDA
jgi:hypothetical protein